MSQDLINRYQPGGDIYAGLVTKYGQSVADAAAHAALSGDETQINAALAGAPLDTSVLDIFTKQIVTDPLAAPLAGLNNTLGNTVLSFIRNPWVLAAVAVITFGAMGGFGWLGKKLFNA